MINIFILRIYLILNSKRPYFYSHSIVAGGLDEMS